MDIFEYLPQLIVAYDGNDEFANLIHVKKADREKDYFCPCCGGTVKPRALDSNKEQSHYYHKTGKCTKESQLHFFCKNWLFEEGSKFYIDGELFEVASIEIERKYSTPFGDYKPDITVHTKSEKTIYFEMFFTNRKTGDDYFCKWESLGNAVVEVNIKEYMFKTDVTIIPSFTYLYHNGVCYSKPYVKRDLYANTIARIKHELTRQKVLNYKARIEQLDWFWQEIRNNTKETILDVVSKMEYEDMVSCYEIIKRKQCVSYLKEDILNMINQKVISDVRKSLELPTDDKDIFFDLEHIRGRTYRAGIRLNFKSEHITHNILYTPNNYWYSFERLNGFPKIVFSKNIMNKNELIISEDNIDDLKKIYDCVIEHKENILKYEKQLLEFEGVKYKIRVTNNLHTVLLKTNSDNYEILLDNYQIESFDIDDLSKTVEYKLSDKKNKEFLTTLFNSDEYNSFSSKLSNYDIINARIDIYETYSYTRNCNHIYFKLYINERCVYDKKLKREISDFMKKTNECELIIQDFMKQYDFVTNLIKKVNDCSNKFWKAQFYFDWLNRPTIEIDQQFFIPRRHLTKEKIYLNKFSEQNIVSLLKTGMHNVLKNMERCGYRVMEVRD